MASYSVYSNRAKVPKYFFLSRPKKQLGFKNFDILILPPKQPKQTFNSVGQTTLPQYY